jgi:hypothetical protein
VEVTEGHLAVEPSEGGGHRFLLSTPAGATLSASPPFDLFGADETSGGLALAGEQLLALFSSATGPRLALLDVDDVLEILEPEA